METKELAFEILDRYKAGESAEMIGDALRMHPRLVLEQVAWAEENIDSRVPLVATERAAEIARVNRWSARLEVLAAEVAELSDVHSKVDMTVKLANAALAASKRRSSLGGLDQRAESTATINVNHRDLSVSEVDDEILRLSRELGALGDVEAPQEP